MSTHPFIPLYVDDYDAATAHLTEAQDGIYGRLLRLCWRTPGCSLPNDEAWIARKIRVTAARWKADGKPVLDEFFRLQRGRLVQKRLKAEYDNISRKKTARVAAGKKGGVAKALKSRDNPPSNATVLLPDTRASQNHNQNHIEEPPKPPVGAFDPVAKDFEQAWAAYPESGRATSNREKSRQAFDTQLVAAGGCAPLRRAVEAYAAAQASQGPKAKAPPAFHRWLADRRFDAYLAEATVQAPDWPGPPEVWNLVAAPPRDEAYAIAWLSRCTWSDVPKAVIGGVTSIDKLRADLGREFEERGIELRERAA